MPIFSSPLTPVSPLKLYANSLNSQIQASTLDINFNSPDSDPGKCSLLLNLGASWLLHRLRWQCHSFSTANLHLQLQHQTHYRAPGSGKCSLLWALKAANYFIGSNSFLITLSNASNALNTLFPFVLRTSYIHNLEYSEAGKLQSWEASHTIRRVEAGPIWELGKCHSFLIVLFQYPCVACSYWQQDFVFYQPLALDPGSGPWIPGTGRPPGSRIWLPDPGFLDPGSSVGNRWLSGHSTVIPRCFCGILSALWDCRLCGTVGSVGLSALWDCRLCGTVGSVGKYWMLNLSDGCLIVGTHKKTIELFQ